jgi:hypothetical protein
MTSFLQLADAKLKDLQAIKRKQKNIINVLIECLQNAMFHGDVENHGDGVGAAYKSCLVALGHETGEFYIYAGNYLSLKAANVLQEKLTRMGAKLRK